MKFTTFTRLSVLFACFVWSLASAGDEEIWTHPAMSGDDLIDAKDKMVVPAPSLSWTGFYIGANIGGAWGKANARTTSLLTGGYFVDPDTDQIADVGSQDLDPSGLIAGGQIGYNYQTSRLVFGVEADFNMFNLEDSQSGTQEYITVPGTYFTLGQSVSTDWLFTARARLGLTAGRFLFYGTGGVALTRIDYNETFTDTFGPAQESGSFDETKAGFAVGCGIEYQLNSHWSVKAEYLYVDFGQVSTTSTNLISGGTSYPGHVFNHSSDLAAHIARFGINYKF